MLGIRSTIDWRELTLIHEIYIEYIVKIQSMKYAATDVNASSPNESDNLIIILFSVSWIYRNFRTKSISSTNSYFFKFFKDGMMK